MMKIWVILATASTLAACAQTSAEPKIGMANPASVFCEKQGGKSVNRKNADGGEYGVCVFADGREVEEWAYFRANSPK